MVAEEHEESAVSVKALKQTVNFPMGIVDVGKAPVFPKFVAVAQFDIGEAVVVVMFQCSGEERPIFDKAVRPGTCTAVAVAHDHDPGMIVKRNVQGV